jgi:hypothetical protein
MIMALELEVETSEYNTSPITYLEAIFNNI